MKRSEMKDFLIDKINNKWDLPWEEFGDPILNQDEFADNILSWLEEAGMLPPAMPGIYDNVPTVTPTGNLDYSWKRGWEE